MDDFLWTATYGPPAAGARIGTLEGYDLAHPGKHTCRSPSRRQAKGNYVTKLVEIANAFWLTALGRTASAGLEPFTITG